MINISWPAKFKYFFLPAILNVVGNNTHNGRQKKQPENKKAPPKVMPGCFLGYRMCILYNASLRLYTEGSKKRLTLF
jgi:hypothetical protein